MVIFHGERLPGDRRTARLSVRARRFEIVAARYRLPADAGQRPGGGAHELPQSIAIPRGTGQGWNGPARRSECDLHHISPPLKLSIGQ